MNENSTHRTIQPQTRLHLVEYICVAIIFAGWAILVALYAFGARSGNGALGADQGGSTFMVVVLLSLPAFGWLMRDV